MDGFVSLLPQPFYQQVEQIWDDLESRFQIRGVRITPFPHFSWNIANSYAEDELKQAAQTVAEHIRPFRVIAAGIGVFSGKSPVVFVPVIKTLELCDVHARIWKATRNIGRGMSMYYDPENWSPHITLVFNDATPENFGGIMGWLGFQTILWDLLVDNLTLLIQPGGQAAQKKFSVSFASKG